MSQSSLARLGQGKPPVRIYRPYFCRPGSRLAHRLQEVPQYLLEAGLASDGLVAVTQPRKVAATSLATRVAKEQQTSVGARVGYSVRFDEASSSETRIKYVTDGMLVRELLGDPLLLRYSVIVVDEAHERTLRTDLLIANLKTIQQARKSGSPGKNSDKGKGKARDTSGSLPPLKVVIMSATLEAEKFSRFFNGCVHPSPPRRRPLTHLPTARRLIVPRWFMSKGASTRSQFTIPPRVSRIMSTRPSGPSSKFTPTSPQGMCLSSSPGRRILPA